MGNKKILFFLSGSIACFKACEVISDLVKKNHHVQCVCSENSLHFIGRATLEGLTGNPVLTSEFQSGNTMDHIHWMRESDLFILCPATANTINSLAAGSGGIINTFFLAYDFKKPFLVYPAMNTKMWDHPATQASIEKLQSWGIKVKDTNIGELACGENGKGRLLEVNEILSDIYENLEIST